MESTKTQFNIVDKGKINQECYNNLNSAGKILYDFLNDLLEEFPEKFSGMISVGITKQDNNTPHHNNGKGIDIITTPTYFMPLLWTYISKYTPLNTALSVYKAHIHNDIINDGRGIGNKYIEYYALTTPQKYIFLPVSTDNKSIINGRNDKISIAPIDPINNKPVKLLYDLRDASVSIIPFSLFSNPKDKILEEILSNYEEQLPLNKKIIFSKYKLTLIDRFLKDIPVVPPKPVNIPLYIALGIGGLILLYYIKKRIDQHA